jgi:L-threonylcarbamoyladenylate synthase
MPSVTAGTDFVAIRMPAHPVFQKILKLVGKPLVAPSANKFQGISPTTPEHVIAELGERIPYVVDGGACSVGIESTILWIKSTSVSLLRPGGIPVEALRKVTGRRIRTVARSSGDAPSKSSRKGPELASGDIAPGMGTRHYAPGKPVALAHSTRELLEKAVALSKTFQSLGVLTRNQRTAKLIKKSLGKQSIIEIASPEGDPEESARRLYACLRRLDASVCDFLLLEVNRSKAGLLRAIHDRLQRAAG